MTVADLRTPGEHATDILRNLQLIEHDYRPGQRSDSVEVAARGLVQACERLMHKFPRQSQLDFAKRLPLTDLELSLLDHTELLEDPEVTARLIDRIGSWVTASHVQVEGTDVRVADFLATLRQHLDSWDERAAATEAIARALHH